MSRPPIIGITTDVHEGRARVKRTYAEAVVRAGGVPVLISPPEDPAEADALARLHAEAIDALVLTGGDDPRTEPFGAPTDPRITPVDASRQAYETALCAFALGSDLPTLGVCLGMQMLALAAGGVLDQWMPDSTPTHAEHWGDRAHAIEGTDGFPSGTVTSHHRQAIADAGRLRVVARAHDGVIEAIDDPGRPCLFGVQWHPERTAERGLGDALFERLVNAAG